MSNCSDFSCKAAPPPDYDLKNPEPLPPEPRNSFTKIGFIVDATWSRHKCWDDTQKAQAKMFHEIETKYPGQSLKLKLVYFGGGEVSEYDWVDNAHDMESAMAPIECRAGNTNIIPSLEKFLNDGADQVQSIILIGDAAEDNDLYLKDIAKKLKGKKIKVYTYLDGKNSDAECAFKTLSKITGGEFHRFSNKKELEEALVQTTREAVHSHSNLHSSELELKYGAWQRTDYKPTLDNVRTVISDPDPSSEFHFKKKSPTANLTKTDVQVHRPLWKRTTHRLIQVFGVAAMCWGTWQFIPEEMKKIVSQSVTEMDPKYILDYFKETEEKSQVPAVGVDDGKPFDGEDQTLSGGGGLFGQGRETIVLDGLYFDYDRAFFPDGNENETLIKMSEIFKRGRCKGYELTGHTDGKGTEEYNQILSEQRAESIRSILLSLGVLNIKTFGKGESQPLASNDTESGRKQNRRVEVRCVR